MAEIQTKFLSYLSKCGNYYAAFIVLFDLIFALIFLFFSILEIFISCNYINFHGESISKFFANILIKSYD